MAASVRRDIMALLTQAVMVRANTDVDRMSAQQKVALADEIYVQQPNLLASILEFQDRQNQTIAISVGSTNAYYLYLPERQSDDFTLTT